MTTLTCTPTVRTTKSLLGYGVIAGPLYVAVSLAQALTRPGFDLSTHAWSLLENGDLGWLQVTNFALTGAMTIAGAVGLHRALPPGRTRRWAPRLISGYGAGMIGAAVLRADPAQGFPVGTPDTTVMTWHGIGHFVSGGLGFLCLIAACFVMATRYTRTGHRGLAWFSRITGVAFLTGFAGIASGSHGPTTLGFVAAVMIACGWLSTVAIHTYRAV